MSARIFFSTLTSVVVSSAVLGAMALSFSPLARTEAGLALTAGVWLLVAGMSLHLVARRAERPVRGRDAPGERLADAG